ncbi:hypothetical protein GCM10010446_32460 [Streptomyces enissocaesilis]|uniref:Uncharacterized protein n=1 Tax=Streptomyces enissocaesilis TaxID=332589 RepID=A0ABN3XAH6_9ACTN
MCGEGDQGVEALARRLQLGDLRRRAGTFVKQARQQPTPAAVAEPGTARLRFIASFRENGRFSAAWRTVGN